MTTRITLTIEEEVVKTAKKYASLNGSSLSDLVEDYLKKLPNTSKSKRKKFSPQIEELLGAVKVPKDFDYKTELETAIRKKHLQK